MGATSADTAIQLIREARRSEEVVAIVVRVDSPKCVCIRNDQTRT